MSSFDDYNNTILEQLICKYEDEVTEAGNKDSDRTSAVNRGMREAYKLGFKVNNPNSAKVRKPRH